MSSVQLQINVKVSIENQSTMNSYWPLRTISMLVDLIIDYIVSKRKIIEKSYLETSKEKKAIFIFLLLLSECVGRFGINCSESCPTGFFGIHCQEKCSCSDEMCDKISGCRNRNMGKVFINTYINYRVVSLFELFSFSYKHGNGFFCQAMQMHYSNIIY